MLRSPQWELPRAVSRLLRAHPWRCEETAALSLSSPAPAGHLHPVSNCPTGGSSVKRFLVSGKYKKRLLDKISLNLAKNQKTNSEQPRVRVVTSRGQSRHKGGQGSARAERECGWDSRGAPGFYLWMCSGVARRCRLGFYSVEGWQPPILRTIWGRGRANAQGCRKGARAAEQDLARDA